MRNVTPWPQLVKRLRFLSALKQCEFAERLGVDQGSVSRWERGESIPNIPKQKCLRDMLHKLEPSIPPAFVEAMPVRAIMHSLHDLTVVCAASEKMASEYGSTPTGMRYSNIGPLWPDSVRLMHETLETADAWRSGEVGLVQATIFRINNKWCETTGIPIIDAGLIFYTASISESPPVDLDESQCRVTIINKDEMVS